MEIDRLYPEPARVSVDDDLRDLDLGERAPDGRPYVVLNMIESLDGRTTVNGTVRELTSPIDQARLFGLRAQADAVLVGAGTVRAERYRRVLPDEVDGPRPLMVIVSGRVDLPEDLPLLARDDVHVVIATTADRELGFVTRARVDYLRLPAVDGGGVDAAAMCRALREQYDVRSVVCEGGPRLNDDLFAASLVDELFVAIAPTLVGAGERTLVDAARTVGPRRARLVSAATAEDYLYLRYAF
jgi:5-amino-6-(5-phosphoribosylamino)uracil reductase